MFSRRVCLQSVVLFVSLLAASQASAAAPTDPQAGASQSLQILNVPAALDRAGPLADVPVLVADTGLDLDHPDIASRLFSNPSPVEAPNPDGVPNPGTVPAGAAGWDLVGTNAPPNLAGDADPTDPPGGTGHGTTVAGVLGAAWNNGVGGAGVAPNARFIALRTCWDNDECYQYVQAAAINWAAERGAKVASFSWLSGPIESDLANAIKSNPQMLFVAIPSGNGGAYDADGDDPQPCNLDAPNVLCVSTSAPDDGLDCGAYGPSSVDVAVPTQAMITTTNGGGFAPTSCATSYAAPMAAGVATILFGMNPGASGAAVRAAIVAGARPVDAWQGKSVSGGVVDADSAVAAFQNGDGTAPTLKAKVKGKKVTIKLSEPATLDVKVKKGKKKKTVATLSKDLPAGTSKVKLPTKGKKGKLKRGKYTAEMTATDFSGNVSAKKKVKYKVG